MILLKIIAFVAFIMCGFYSIVALRLTVFGNVYWSKNGTKRYLRGLEGLPLRLIILGVAAILAFLSHLCYNFIFH